MLRTLWDGFGDSRGSEGGLLQPQNRERAGCPCCLAEPRERASSGVRPHPGREVWASRFACLRLRPHLFVESLCWPCLSLVAVGRRPGAVRARCWGRKGSRASTSRCLPRWPARRLCPFLPADSCPCLLLSSLRHLRPLQLHHHPPSEHCGRRVDDVSSRVTVLPGGVGACGFLGTSQVEHE